MRHTHVVFSIILLSLTFTHVLSAPLQYTGVNEAGAEFGVGNDGSGALPGNYGDDYQYPTTFSISHLASKGMNVFRVPFRWERVQPTLNSAFNTTEFNRLTSTINYITSLGAFALLDPHNYARYRGAVIGSGISNSQFQDFWTRLAAAFSTNNRVIFGLMNEPYGLTTENWLSAVNAAISGIRSTGATQLVLVPGNGYTGAHSWYESWYGTPNAQVMQNVVDSANNYAYEVHQYLDGDFSGTGSGCQSTTVGSAQLQQFTQWLNTNNKKGFLGEFAGGNNPTCQAAIGDMLNYMETNSNVWLGYTWWAAGPKWGNYMFTLEPNSDGSDQPQLAWLIPHLRGVGSYIPASSVLVSPSSSYRPPGQTSVIYSDSVQSPWSSVNTWAQSYSFSNPSPVHSGSYSIRFQPSNYDGLYFTCGSSSCFDSSSYAISMYVNPGSSSAAIRLTAYRNSNSLSPAIVQTATNQNQWNYLVFMISSFNSPGSFSGFTIQLDTGSGSNIYIDDISLLVTAPGAASVSNSPVSASASSSKPPVSASASATSASGSAVAASSAAVSISRSPVSASASATSASKSPVASPSSTVATGGSGIAVYTEGLQASWTISWSWNANYNALNTAPTHSGSYSLSFTNPSYSSGLYFACNSAGTSCFSSSYSSLNGWVNGGTTGGQALQFQLRRSGQPVGNVVSFTATANTWVQFSISIPNQFAPGAGDLMGFTIVGSTGSGSVYLDDIYLS